MPSRENNWLRGLDRWLDQQPRCFYINLHGSAWQKSGLPDRLILMDGRLIAVEAKQEGKQPTDLQKYILLQIMRAGGYAVEGATSSAIVIAQILDIRGY